MKKRQLQAGFSLVEAVLVTVLTVIVFATFGTFLLRLQTGVSNYKERAFQNEDVGLTTQNVIDDLEKVGTNLSLSSKDSFTGTVFVPFLSYSGYQVTGNRISRSGSLVNALVSAVWWNGKGELKWRGNEYLVTVQDGSRIIQINQTSYGLSVTENGNSVFQRTVTPGSMITLVTSTVIVAGDAVCRTGYKVENETVFETTGSCFTDSVEILVNLAANEGYVDEMSLNAAEIILRSTSSFPVRLPLLPISNNSRMETPLVASNNGFYILAGDERRDEMYLQADAVFSGSPQTIQVADNSGISVGDALFLADYLNNRSVLLKVTALTPLTVVPVTQADNFGNGFDKFYSSTADFSGFTFLRGSRLTKLAVPVEYQVQTENDVSSLYRRRLGSAWELVAPNIQNFAISQNVSQSRVGFVITFDVLTEGADNGRVAQPVRIEVSPRSLNRTYEAR